eukprot:353647-Chlamydomonas_euryale.AAC.1
MTKPCSIRRAGSIGRGTARCHPPCRLTRRASCNQWCRRRCGGNHWLRMERTIRTLWVGTARRRWEGHLVWAEKEREVAVV